MAKAQSGGILWHLFVVECIFLHFPLKSGLVHTSMSPGEGGSLSLERSKKFLRASRGAGGSGEAGSIPTVFAVGDVTSPSPSPRLPAAVTQTTFVEVYRIGVGEGVTHLMVVKTPPTGVTVTVTVDRGFVVVPVAIDVGVVSRSHHGCNAETMANHEWTLFCRGARPEQGWAG